MNKINILTEGVYNRISAGEVVDRPYSVVKELVENSIDSGATEIEISIEQGGKQLIRVRDDGCGIERDDLKRAFLPHATSKIAKAEDLDAIETLGFRGEALASIGAVSRAEIVSSTGEDGFQVSCYGGKIGDVRPAACERGTSVTVRDLFFNTPVRAKYMKAEKKEQADITTFVTRLILSRPNISFTYTIDGAVALQSFGEGLEEAVTLVYGPKTLSQCFYVEAKVNDISVSGFCGNQNFFKSNKSYEAIFLNGRCVQNQTIALALTNAYAPYAMKRQYPFYVLNVDMPSDRLDVNVHPSKSDVRFLDPHAVYDAVYKAVSSVLDGTAKAAEFEVKTYRTPVVQSYMPAEDRDLSAMQRPAAPKASIEPQRGAQTPFEPKARGSSEKAGESAFVSKNPAAEPERVQRKEKDEQQAISELKKYRYKGNFFETFLIYESEDEAYIIDQHAAHERLNFDRLIAKVRERKSEVQPLLVPYAFEANAEESRFLDDALGVLNDLGFETSSFGPGSYKVDAVPLDLVDIDLKGFFDEVLSSVNDLKAIKLEDLLRDRLAMTACKHAIKAGQRLEESEVEELFRLLNGNWGLKCPHGRPICVRLRRTDIEKMFKRIV